MSRVHRTNKGEILKTYRFLPYDKIAEVLKNDGEAFLEQDDDRPLKRSTMWRAAKKLSNMLGTKVRYDRAVFRLNGVDVLEGYAFSIEDQKSPPPKDNDVS